MFSPVFVVFAPEARSGKILLPSLFLAFRVALHARVSNDRESRTLSPWIHPRENDFSYWGCWRRYVCRFRRGRKEDFPPTRGRTGLLPWRRRSVRCQPVASRSWGCPASPSPSLFPRRTGGNPLDRPETCLALTLSDGGNNPLHSGNGVRPCHLHDARHGKDGQTALRSIGCLRPDLRSTRRLPHRHGSWRWRPSSAPCASALPPDLAVSSTASALVPVRSDQIDASLWTKLLLAVPTCPSGGAPARCCELGPWRWQ